jgi:hypothetical protein
MVGGIMVDVPSVVVAVIISAFAIHGDRPETKGLRTFFPLRFRNSNAHFV